MLVTDCGKASRVTLGQPNQFYFELGAPPFNRNAHCLGFGCAAPGFPEGRTDHLPSDESPAPASGQQRP